MRPDIQRDGMEGQLAPLERLALWVCARSLKPARAFEFGTWKGGGSTYTIACALDEVGSGKLYSCEMNPEFAAHARALYGKGGDLEFLAPHVELMEGDAETLIPPLMKDGADFLFMDGPEDPAATFRHYQAMAPLVRKGGVVAFHDWGGEKTKDVKAMAEADMALHSVTGSLAVFRRI